MTWSVLRSCAACRRPWLWMSILVLFPLLLVWVGCGGKAVKNGSDAVVPDGGLGCGNGQLDPGEVCDGEQLGGSTCQSLGWVGGQLGCTDVCTRDESACHRCGNDQIDNDEACDGGELGTATCVSLGFEGGGSLSCASDCTLVTSGCFGVSACSATGGTLSCGQVVTGDTGDNQTTSDVLDHYIGGYNCPEDRSLDAPETIYQLVLDPNVTTIQVTLTDLSANLDAVLLAAGPGQTCSSDLTCPAFSGGGGTEDEYIERGIEWEIDYFLVVDGANDARGTYTLRLDCIGWELCDDGLDNDGDGATDCLDSNCYADPLCRVRQLHERFRSTTGTISCHGFDLNGTTLTFNPDPLEGYIGSAADGVTGYPTTPGSGTPSQTVSFSSPNDFVNVPFVGGQTFPFYGGTYADMWLNSNGSVSFGAGDPDPTPTEIKMALGPPRIAGQWASLDASTQGTVTVDTFPDRVVVTYDDVACGFLAESCSFQMELHWNGIVTITNLQHDPGIVILVGVSEGGGAQFEQTPPEVDLYAHPSPVKGTHEYFNYTLTPAHVFDLHNTGIVFTPDSMAPQLYTYQVQPAPIFPFTPGTGDLSTLSFQFVLPQTHQHVISASHTVNYYGVTYSSFWVNPNGTITFGQNDPQHYVEPDSHYALPRISGLFKEWDWDIWAPAVGTLYVDEFVDVNGYVAVVTFDSVYDLDGDAASFQISIRTDGTVTLHYTSVISQGGLVGISSGDGGWPMPSESNFVP